MATPKEQVYDTQISPLMVQIIKICKENRIAFLFDAALGFDGDSDSQLRCTSYLLEDDCEPTDEMLQAVEHLRPESTTFLAFTITTSNEGFKQQVTR